MTPDREKVISELQAWIDDPYARDTAIDPTLVHDALALLKELEAVSAEKVNAATVLDLMLATDHTLFSETEKEAIKTAIKSLKEQVER